MENQNNKPILLLEAPKIPPKSSIQGDTTETPKSPFINGDKRADEGVRDPTTGQFLRGNEGGPGRPIGAHKMAALIEEELQEMGAKDAQGNPVPIKRALVKKIVKMALGGDRKMIEMIWNYQDGKPPQHIDVTSKGQHIGKRKLSAEEIKHVDDLFAPKDWPDEQQIPLPIQPSISNEPKDNKPKANKNARKGNLGKDTDLNQGGQRGAYESHT